MDTKELSKTGNKTIKFIIISLLIIAIISLIGFAFARYITKINEQAIADVAQYSFNVTAGSNTNLNIDLADTRLANDTTKVESGYVAPDTKGAFTLNVDATGTQVALVYNIDLDLSSVPENLKFYSDAQMKNEVMVQDNKIKIEDFIGVNDTKTETITMYWSWPYETGENDYEIGLNDVKDSAWMGQDIEIAVNATGKQVPGRVTYLADSVQIGDYVNYDATSGDGEGLNITPQTNKTGSSTLTTFNSSDITGWRVYDVDSLTKTVTLIAEEPTSKTLTLSNKTGWKNAVNVLNSIGDIYGHGNGATSGRSIQGTDISSKSTFNPENFKNNQHQTDGVNDGYWYYTGNPNRRETETYTSGTFIMDNNSEIKVPDNQSEITMKQTYYGYTGSTIDSSTGREYITQPYYNLIFKQTTSTWKPNYWVATRYSALVPSYCAFGVYMVGSGIVNGYGLYNSVSSVNIPSYAFVPIVTLQSNIQVNGQDSNNVWQLDIE